VLISLVILSTGVVLVLRAFGTSLSALHESRDAMLGNLLIRETISGVRLKALENGSIASSDKEEISGPDALACELQIKGMLVSPDRSNTLNRVVVTVWRDRDSAQYSASTFVVASKRETAQ
jgi:hypothetical protein